MTIDNKHLTAIIAAIATAVFTSFGAAGYTLASAPGSNTSQVQENKQAIRELTKDLHRLTSEMNKSYSAIRVELAGIRKDIQYIGKN